MKSTITLLGSLLLFGQVVFGQNYLMSAALTSVNDCSGFFLDSGGGTASYGPNQNFTTVICPDLTTGTHVQLVFSGTELAGGDELCFFDGNSTAATSLGCASDFNGNASFIIQATAANPSGCLTVTFNSDAVGEAAGWSADMNCIPSCQTILAVMDSTDPIIEPADTGWIDICPGDRVFFYGKGSYPQNGVAYQHSDLTSDFEWDFGDGTITYGPTVSHEFMDPGGYIVQLSITDQFGCKNTNYLSQRVRVAPRPKFMTGDWVDQICVGDTIHLNSMVDSMDMNHTVSVEPAEESFQSLGVRSDSLPLPDGNGASYSTTITFTDFAPGQTLTDINDLIAILVTMEHSWMRDLQIKLTCPNGQTAMLHNHPGQTGGEVFLGDPYESDEGFPTPIPGVGYEYGWAPNPDYNYTWIQYANSFNPGTLPEGTYKPFQPLTNFLGCPLNGDWTIQVTDLWQIDNGYIFSWSIEFAQDLYPDLETFAPSILTWEWNNHPSIFMATPDSIAGAPFNAGEVAYTFTVHDEFGCAWDTTIDIQVLPVTHPLCHSCDDILTPNPDTTVCTGEPVGLDVTTTLPANTNVTFESYDNYAIGASNHPPNNPYNSIIQVNSINPANITNIMQDIVSVCLDLDTDFDADIQIFLKAPNGQLLMLSTNNGGSGDNYKQTCFTPSATTPITAAAAPFTGNFQPEGAWTVLNNSPINGAWALRVSDAFGINAMGKLNWWSITFRSKNNITYSWTPSAGLTCTTCPTPTATPLVNTNYIVTGSDSYGCQSKDTIAVNVLNSFNAPVVNMQQTGFGEITATWTDINPGLPYEVNVNNTGWVPSNNGNLSHLITGLVNGTTVGIQVRTNVNGAACQVGVGNSQLLYFFCPITASLSGSSGALCNNSCDGAAQISVVNGQSPFDFEILNLGSGTTTNQPTGNINGLCPGNYRVIVTDAGMCPDTVLFSISNPSPLVINATQVSPVKCTGGSDGCAQVAGSGGTGSLTYTWGNANMSTQQSICNLPAGQVSVSVSDANGCMASTSVTVTELPAIALVLSKTDVKCKGGNDGTATVAATGGAGSGYTYQWSSGTAPGQPVTGGLQAGLVSVTVTDPNGCQAFGSITLGEPATAVEVSAAQTVVSCFGENLSEANAVVVGGTGPYTFNWSLPSQTQPTATNLMPGTYTVTATDAGGCTATDQLTVTQWAAFDLLISAVPPTCFNVSDGELGVVVLAGGNGTYNYEWNNGTQSDFNNNLMGGLSYTVTVTDGQGCTGTKTRFLENPLQMELSLTQDAVNCFGANDGTATVSNVLNGVSPFDYLWDGNAAGQTSATATGLAAGSYEVTVTDLNGCTAEATVAVLQPTALSVDFETVSNECFGYENGVAEAEVAGGTPSYSFAWSNGSSAAKIVELAADTYTLTITDVNGCTLVDSVGVSAPDPVSANLSVRNVSCFGDRDGSITLAPTGGTQPFKYSLNGTDFYGSSTLIALEAGEYTVYLKDAEGCIYTDEATVVEPPQMTVAITAWGADLEEYMIDYGGTFPVVAVVENNQGSVMYTWDAAYCGTLFQDTTSDCTVTHMTNALWAKPEYTNDYYVLAVDSMGCEAEDHLQVHVKKQRRVVVPTGFTPNANGTNDRLSVHGKSGTMVMLYQVYDRWGNLLFEDREIPINDTTRGWDGTFKSQEMQPGVYVWYLEAMFEDGMTETYKGETTLIR